MKCTKCGAEIRDDSIFCNYCGKKQIKEKRPKLPKRGNGTGSVFVLNGKWTAQITLGWYVKNGKAVAKRHRKTGFRTKKEALGYLASFNADMLGERNDPSVQKYIDTYLNGEYRRLSKSKQDAYSYAIERLAPIAHRRIKSLGIKDLQSVIDSADLTYYPSRDMKTVLSHIYKLAIAEQVVTVNLSQYLVLPELKTAEAEAFTPDEITKLWEACEDNDPIAPFILLMIYTGMMPGELLNTRISNIVISERKIVNVGIKTKTRREASIALPDAVIPILEPYVESSDPAKDPKLVRMNKDTFYREYYETLAKYGIRRLKPYSCRHTTATALSAKIPAKTLQKVMRHASFQSTQHYIHPDTQDVLNAVNLL